MTLIVNVAELATKDWTFIENRFPSSPSMPITWRHFSGTPSNALESRISKPKLSRYRACLQATLAIRTANDIVVSHLPRTSNWQSVFMNVARRRNPHLAFSFNFTDLPQGRTLSQMRKNFQRIDRFVVYSNYERELYSSYFDLPIEKFDMLHWAMDMPYTSDSGHDGTPPYYCAVGGEGRDLISVIDAFRKLPHLRLIIITRRYAMGDINMPSNVEVHLDVPVEQYWRVVARSRAVCLALRDEHTACGHITLVGSMMLKRPVITTFSQGTRDYVRHEENALVVPPKNVDALVGAIEKIESDSELATKLGASASDYAAKHCYLENWVAYLDRFIKHFYGEKN